MLDGRGAVPFQLFNEQAFCVGGGELRTGGVFEFCAAADAMRNASGTANMAFAIVICLTGKEFIVQCRENSLSSQWWHDQQAAP